MQNTILFALIICFLGFSSILYLNDNSYGVVTQEKEIVRVVSSPGVYFKIPFYQKVYRILKHLAVAQKKFQSSSLDGKKLKVKISIFWKVSDPAIYFKREMSFNSTRKLIVPLILKDTENIVSKTKIFDLMTCPAESKEDLCLINPDLFSGTFFQTNKLLESYGIRITHIQGEAKVAMP